MEFCSVCDNMLYLKLKTDDVDKTNYRQKAYIEKYCKSCGYKTSKVTDSCFYKNTYNVSVSSSTHQENLNKFILQDRTVPRTNKLQCPNSECVSNTQGIENDIRYIPFNDVDMKYVYICGNCQTSWKNTDMK